MIAAAFLSEHKGYLDRAISPKRSPTHTPHRAAAHGERCIG
jgi:hypothetical protein